MRTSHFEPEVRRGPGTVILDLRGEIDGFSEERLAAAFTEAERAGPEAILLNFAQVRYINSTGIALIVNLLGRARAARRRLLAYGLSDHYAEIFAITRLSDFIPVYADEAAALAAAGRGVSSPGAEA